MAAPATSSDHRPRARLAVALGLLAILAAVAWAAATAVRMREREVRSLHALTELHRMRHATRALLSARSAFPELAARWTVTVADFTGALAKLAQTSADPRLSVLTGTWQDIHAEVPPVQAAIAAIAASPLAQLVGDEGVEQTAARLLADRHATAGLLELRRLQRHLGAFDSLSDGFASRLETTASALASDAVAATRLASACAVLLLVAALAIGAWLLLRIARLNSHLRGALGSLERAQAESAHREQVLRAVLDSLGEGVVLIDADGRVAWANPTAHQLVGDKTVLVPGARWQGLLDLRDRDGRALHPAADTLPQRWLDAQLRHGGDEVRIDLATAPVLALGDRPGLVVVLVDLTARRVLEEQLRHAQSLESLGRLAGGIAHDFNNLLAGILGNAELLGSRLADRPELRKRVDTIITASSNAATLTRQLLDSARRSSMQRCQLDLHLLIRDSVALLARTLDSRIDIASSLEAPNPWIDGDPALLQNALVNLAVNARDAMPDGGRLRITTTAVAAPAETSGEWLELRVTDTGCGIPPEILPRIFEAFFTTKPVGKGSGLGLAAVLGTVARHDGRISVDSRPGEGTAIIIQLPACSPPVRSPSGAAKVQTPRSGLRILLADDEAIIRTVATEMLHEIGCLVHTVDDGIEAVAALRADPTAYDAVILDLVMPRMGGVEALHALRSVSPGLPVLLWSGYSAGHDVASLLRDGSTTFIAKPATHAVLNAALTSVLASRNAPAD